MKKIPTYDSIETDLDLPESKRTQANMWKAKYFAMLQEVQRANKGIRRLKRKLEKGGQHVNRPGHD